MRQKKTKQKRIAIRTVRFAVIGSVVLGIATLLAGLLIYHNTLLQVSISRGRSTVVRAAAAVQNSADVIGLSEDVMGIYSSLTPEQRSRTGTEKYRALFRQLETVTSPDGAGSILPNVLENYRTDVAAIFVCTLDRENSALVCLASTPGDDSPAPGDWTGIPAGWSEQIASCTKPDGTDGSALCFFRRTQVAGKECLAVYPMSDESADISGIEGRNPVCLVATLPISSVTQKVVHYAFCVGGVVLALTLLFAFIAGKHMKRTVADPVNAIADAAAAYVRDKKNGLARSDHFSSIGIQTGDELENLTEIMAGMEQDLSEYEEGIKRAAAEKERIRTELDLASRIQFDALPSVFPPFPGRKEFELFASMDPAKEVGGDFYDFFLVDDDHLALVIADVSGKGIPAALFMMVSKSLIKNQLLSGRDPAQALTHANIQLCDGNTSSSFVTVWLAVLQISTGKVKACNAGHENPCLRSSDEPYELLKYKHNVSVGVIENAVYQNREFELRPGDSLFVYTDGVPEAQDAEGGMFGEAQLLDTLNRNPNASPEELVGSMRKAINEFVKDAPQFDDITMLAFRYNGPETKA